MTNSPPAHQPVNVIPVRGQIEPANVNPTPVSPPAPRFSEITRSPVAPPTPFSNVRPIDPGTPATVPSAPAIPLPASAPSPAVRPLR